MTELQQFMDVLMGYLHIFVKLTIKRFIYTAIFTALIIIIITVIGASCNIQCVRNVFDQIKEISYFFKFSEPLKKRLINSIKEHAPDSQK